MIGYMLVDSSPGPTQDIMHFQDTGVIMTHPKNGLLVSSGGGKTRRIYIAKLLVNLIIKVTDKGFLRLRHCLIQLVDCFNTDIVCFVPFTWLRLRG